MMATQHYQLPIEAILETMSELRDTVVLYASLPPVPGLLPEACVAEVIMKKGACHSCMVTLSTGRPFLEGQEAYHALLQCGDLLWHLQSTLPSNSHPFPQEEPQPRQMSPPPSYRRMREFSADKGHALSHLHKRVFLLVNGANSQEKIARLLNKPVPEIQRILAELQDRQLIG